MPHFIPQGITDIVIEHLRNEPAMLDTCCLVPRTWIHRARKYLFVGIEFFLFRRRVSQWRGTFLAIRSLHFTFALLPNSDILFLPLLEDLTLISRGRGGYGSGVGLYFSTEHGSFESVPVIFVFDVVAKAHNMLPDVRWTPTRRGFGRGLFRLYRYHGGGKKKVSRRQKGGGRMWLTK